MLILGLIDYIFYSLALYNLAQSRNLNNSYLAWVPILNSYTMGHICDSINDKYNNKKTCFKIIMLIISIYWFMIFVLVNLLPSFNHEIIVNIDTSFLFSMFQPSADEITANILASFLSNVFQITINNATESMVINIASFILAVTCIITFIFHLICACKIFDKYSHKKSSKYIILYIIFNIIPIIPFIPSICLWKSSNNKPVSNMQN